jgi:hypothetical protein
MLKSFILLTQLILFLLIIETKSQNTFVPLKRGAHTATLIDKKLYILGGYSLSGTEDSVVGQQFFYVDFSESFVTTDVKWVDLTSINLAPPIRRASAVRGGENDDKLIVFGGEPVTRELAMVYMFDTVNFSWSTPKLAGSYQPLSKSSLFPVINNKKIYLEGLFSKINPLRITMSTIWLFSTQLTLPLRRVVPSMHPLREDITVPYC